LTGNSDTFHRGAVDFDISSRAELRVRHRRNNLHRGYVVLSGSAWFIFSHTWAGDSSAVYLQKIQDMAGHGAGSLAHSGLSFGGPPFFAVHAI
jgi:hypothetical protein